MSLHDALLAKAFGGGSGGASSWNELTDKPFGEEAVQIIWKSATDVTDYVTPHSQRNVFYKITDEVFDISDLDGAYFVVDMGNGSTTKVDLNNVKEIEGGCSQGNAFCSIYDTIVNLGIASDGKPDTFPSTGTYLGMSRPYDVQVVIPKRIKKIDDKYLPDNDGGSASIDVTAQVGQTIIVKEVDASGKPTKWESADYQPRTHWSEVIRGDILPETGFTPTYNSMLGCTTAIIPSFKLEVGKTYTVIFDGVEYTLTAFAGTVPFNFIAVGNTVFAGGANTGEPFAVAYLTDTGECDVLCMDANSHTVRVIGDVTVYHKIPTEYMPLNVKYVDCTVESSLDATTVTADTVTGTQLIAWISEGYHVVLRVTSTQTVDGNKMVTTDVWSNIDQIQEMTENDGGYGMLITYTKLSAKKACSVLLTAQNGALVTGTVIRAAI